MIPNLCVMQGTLQYMKGSEKAWSEEIATKMYTISGLWFWEKPIHVL